MQIFIILFDTKANSTRRAYLSRKTAGLIEKNVRLLQEGPYCRNKHYMASRSTVIYS